MAGLVLALAVLAAGQPATQVATAVDPSLAVKIDPAKVRTEAIENAMAGQFAKAVEQLRLVAKAKPNDPITDEALRLLTEHMVRRSRAEGERGREYADAVARVEHCRVAQQWSEQADEARLKGLREAVKELGKAYSDGSTADSLEEMADRKMAEDMKARSIAALQKAVEALDKSIKVFDGLTGELPDTFRSVGARAREVLQQHLACWRKVSGEEPAQWRTIAKDLKTVEYDETEVLGDLEAMALEKTWRGGLVQARVAARLAEDGDKTAEKLKKEKWFIDLVAETEARGAKHVKEAEWYDALSAYGALADLLPDNTEYEKQVKVVQRHVRILGMYGRKSPATQGAEEGGEPDWRKLVANVDAQMVEEVIRQVDQAYVSAIDYHQVALGGLTGIKVLAETPQAADSFAGLKDDKARKEFLETVDRLMQDVEKRDRYTHEELYMALNSVLHASEKTVRVPTEVLAVEFTDGFLDELDKFSSMVWPYDVPNFEKQTMGTFYGVGIQITKEPGEPLKVVTPLVGTPAFRAGIKAGDLIIQVRSDPEKPPIPTEKLPVDRLVEMIMGPKGTQVVLTIKRGGLIKDYPLVRDEIRIRTVKGWGRQPKTGDWDYVLDGTGRIGYVRLTQFTRDTPEHLADALGRLQQDGVRSVILDLRFNPGGLLQAAAKVANEFLTSGRIVSTRGRRVRATELNAEAGGRFPDGDLVVLVNQYSASAAEIVAGAVQDWRRAKIIGQRTYGKGSVQNVIYIRDQEARLKLTTAYYYLPQGRLLHKRNGAKEWGVDPDLEVMLTPRQIRLWLDLRRKSEVIQDDSSPEQVRQELAFQYDSDIQLNTAVLMLKLMQLQHRSRTA